MFKSILILISFSFTLIISGQTYLPTSSSSSSSSDVLFIKPKVNIMRRVNPLKLFFNIVYNPNKMPHYKLDWNLSFLKTFLLESTFVSDEDKTLFLMKFSNIENDYPQWSQEQHDELERFTEKYLNLYASPETFLPFLDCPALTYAITDEMLNDLSTKINEEKRSKIRAKAVESLCDLE